MLLNENTAQVNVSSFVHNRELQTRDNHRDLLADLFLENKFKRTETIKHR